MQDITPLPSKGSILISRYGSSGFETSGGDFSTNIALTDSSVQEWSGQGFEFFDSIKDAEIYIIGTGAKQKFLSAEDESALNLKNIFPDVMDTGAACRTFNILVTEGRKVAALIRML
jgi:uncharacterized protein